VWPATLQSKTKRVSWKTGETKTILKMKKDSCSWKEIHAALGQSRCSPLRNSKSSRCDAPISLQLDRLVNTSSNVSATPNGPSASAGNRLDRVWNLPCHRGERFGAVHALGLVRGESMDSRGLQSWEWIYTFIFGLRNDGFALVSLCGCVYTLCSTGSYIL